MRRRGCKQRASLRSPRPGAGTALPENRRQIRSDSVAAPEGLVQAHPVAEGRSGGPSRWGPNGAGRGEHPREDVGLEQHPDLLSGNPLCAGGQRSVTDTPSRRMALSEHLPREAL